MSFTALLSAYVLVATLGWVNGYIAGRLMERRTREVVDLCDRVQGDTDELLRLLLRPGPYDWASDPAAVEVHP